MTGIIGLGRRATVSTPLFIHTIYTTLLPLLPLPPLRLPRLVLLPPPSPPPLRPRSSIPAPLTLNVTPPLRLPLCDLSIAPHCLFLHSPLFTGDLPPDASSFSTARQVNESLSPPPPSHPRSRLSLFSPLCSSWPRYNGGGLPSSSLSSFSSLSSSLSSPRLLRCCGAAPTRGRTLPR
jgi:hypothetical protein